VTDAAVSLPASPPASTWSFDRAVKDRAVEEIVNLHWHRRLAFLLVRPLERVPAIHPNHITYVGTAIGVAGGVAAFHARDAGPSWLVIAAALMFVSTVLDCADGMLARLRGGGTRFGMLLDGIADQVSGITFWFGVAWSSVAGIDGWWVWPAAVAILVSIVLHTAIYDQLKVAFAVGARLGDAPKPPDLANAGAFERGVEWLYVRAYGTLGDKIRAAADPTIDPARFRAAFAPAMRMVSFLGLGTQITIMYAATALGALEPSIPFWVGLGAIVGALNAWMLVALVAWRRAKRSLAATAP
jgi:hypothetical protein